MGGPHNTDGTVAAVVTVAFNRPDYLERHVASLLSVHSSEPANRCVLTTMAVAPGGIGGTINMHTSLSPAIRDENCGASIASPHCRCTRKSKASL